MSCADVQTIQAGDGTKSEFSFDFPYLFKSEVKVYFWNRVTKEYDEIAQDGSGWGQAPANTIYPWEISDANPTIVHFTEIDSGGNTAAVPPSPAAAVDPNEETVDNVKIRRETSIDDIRALFNPGSAIRSDDLNKNFEQLRYAIQEGNCQGITDDVYEYLKDNYWDRYDNTLYEDDAWVSDDTKIATTAALDKRFQDEVAETITSSESWPDNDDTIATTAAIDNRIDTAITNDIGTDGTGITVTDDGDGTITLGLGAGSIDFDRIKDVDIITQAEQDAGSPAAADNNLFTALAAAKRFDTIVQTTTPSGSDWEVGKSWLQNDADKTFSIWDGDSWEGISSGGTFINQPKVVYVDATNGNDDNDGHRISRPKASIKAAINQINADSTYGDGSIVVVAPGVYREAAPIQIQKRDVSVVGTSLRSCVVHPTQATETNTLFEVNSGTYLKNLTFTGVKASGTRGEAGSLYTDATYGLPATQGWNVAFLAGATIVKSPYIQNCTNFSDSEIDNTDLGFYDGTEDKGRAGDEDSAMTGGGLLVDGSVPAATSPLRSMVCDSYTHVGLDGPGILVTNNGYAQCTSSYAFFNHFHIACINGGQANLAASTSDFGRFSLITDGRSPNAIFTSNVDGAADDGAISFNINAPTASTDLYNEAGTENDNAWWGSATRPQPNMLVEVNGVTYPILSATANTDSEGGAGWTVTISRPDPNNRSTNLGLNGAITDDAAVSFFLRSMIASSGHTMEYVGSGTNYSALPENGGVPNDSNQIIELNNGKVWTAITDHNGKFRIGGNQTTDPIFEVDQQLGFVTIPEGSIAFNLLSDLTPQLGGDLDVNGNTITGLPTTPTSSTEATSKAYVDAQIAGIDEVVEDTTPQLGGNLDVNGNEIVSVSNGDIVIAPDGTGKVRISKALAVDSTATNADLALEPKGTGSVFVNSSRITSVSDPTDAQDAATKNYVDTNSINNVVEDTTPQLGGNLDVNGNTITSASNGNVVIDPDGTGIIELGANVGVGTTSPGAPLEVESSQDILIRAESTDRFAHIDLVDNAATTRFTTDGSTGTLRLRADNGNAVDSSAIQFEIDGSEHVRIDSSGRVGIGTSSPDAILVTKPSGAFSTAVDTFTGDGLSIDSTNSTAGSGNFGPGISWPSLGVSGNRQAGICSHQDTADANRIGLAFFTHPSNSSTDPIVEALRISSSGNVGIGTTSPAQPIDIVTSGSDAYMRQSDGTVTGFVGVNNNNSAFDIYTFTNHPTRFFTNNTERARIDSSGRLLVGTTSEIVSSTANSSVHLVDGGGGKIYMMRDDSGSTVEGNDLGMLRFYSNDGGAQESARIEAEADLDHGTDDKPGRLVFSTTAVGASTPTERMRIKSSGSVLINNTNSTQGHLLQVTANNDAEAILINGRSSDDIGELSFFENDRSTKLGEIQYRQDVVHFRHRVGDIAFATGGVTERARIDSSGRLLVGTSSAPSGSTVLFSGNSFDGSTGDGRLYLNRGSAPSDGTQIGALYYSGNAGADAGASLIAVRDGGTWTSGSSHPTRLVFSTTTDGDSSPTERMRIKQNGQLSTFDSGGYGHVIESSRGASTSDYLIFGRYSATNIVGSGGTQSFGVYTNGNVVNTNNSYGSLSDIKLKENIVDASSQWNDLKAIQVRNYNFKEGQTHTQIGVVAQEIELVSPGLVTESPDRDEEGNDLGTTTKSVNYSVLYMKAVKALQEAMERIETLEAKVAALEAN